MIADNLKVHDFQKKLPLLSMGLIICHHYQYIIYNINIIEKKLKNYFSIANDFRQGVRSFKLFLL